MLKTHGSKFKGLNRALAYSFTLETVLRMLEWVVFKPEYSNSEIIKVYWAFLYLLDTYNYSCLLVVLFRLKIIDIYINAQITT